MKDSFCLKVVLMSTFAYDGCCGFKKNQFSLLLCKVPVHVKVLSINFVSSTNDLDRLLTFDGVNVLKMIS